MFSCIIWTNIVHPNVYILLYFIKLHNCFSGNFPHLTLTPSFNDVLLKNYPEIFSQRQQHFSLQRTFTNRFSLFAFATSFAHLWKHHINAAKQFSCIWLLQYFGFQKSDKTDTWTVTCIGGTVAATFMLSCTENLKCPKHSLYRHKTMQKTVKALTTPEAKRKYLH